MPQTLEQKFVDYVTMTSAAMEKVAQDERQKAAVAAELDALIPQAVQAMVANERIQPGQAEKLAKALRNPVAAIEILAKTADHRNAAEQTAEQVRLGQPDGGEKRAERATRFAPVGGRTSEPRESDFAFLSKLNLSPQA